MHPASALSQATETEDAEDSESIADPPPDTEADSENDGKGKMEELRPFEEVVKDLEVQEGLFTLYQDPDEPKAYLAIQPQQLNRNFLFLATLESGLGEAGLYRGWPINDLLIQFRRAPGNKLQVVVPNLNFRNLPSQPGNRQLQAQSFSDSPLYALKVVSIHPDSEALLVDLNDFVLTRDPANLVAQFPGVFGNYAINPETSNLGRLKLFPQNFEIEAILGFSGGGSTDPLAILFGSSLSTLPDSRGFNLRIRYSLSQLPTNRPYHPRIADERVGYFLTAFRTPTPATRASNSPFVRYIHRWHLEKQDPNAAISPPKEPIVFWIENTVPQAYRQAIRDGILMWNEAFERAGFRDAIEARQMADGADWDPADVRYNVVRWSDSFRPWAIGYGPSRVNPLTGEILDADVILDANVVRFLQRQYQAVVNPLSPDAEAYFQICDHPMRGFYEQWLSGPPAIEDLRASQISPLWDRATADVPDHADACAGVNSQQQVAFGAMTLAALGDPFNQQAELDTYVQQYLRALTAHEIGHVIGLRHNFLGSTLLSPEDLNDRQKTETWGLVSSVMDYFPPNLAPPGQPQGDYFPTKLGPYDVWAIEYGYKPDLARVPQLEQQPLREIAARSNARELAYATDEDIRDFIDPKADVWDMSSDPLQYAQWQMDNAQAIWQKLDWFAVDPGEGYGQLRDRFSVVLDYYLRQAFTISNYIGGQRFLRTDPWSSRGQRPFQPIAAEEQRAALEALRTYVFDPEVFQFPPDLINSLAPDRWRHWGQGLTRYPLDYPIYDRVLFLQSMVLNDLLYADRLVRLRDAELRAGEVEPLPLTELFTKVGQIVWGDLLTDNNLTTLSSLERGLQRHHLTILTNMVLRGYDGLMNAQSLLEFMGAATTLGTPEDARVLARLQLKEIDQAITTTLNRTGEGMELTTRAHLEDVRDRIDKILGAELRGS